MHKDTHRLDEQGPHLLLGVPRLHAVPHLLQELLVVFQKLGDLVEDLVHQRRVTQQGVLRLLQGLHVALEDPQDQCVFLQTWHPHLTCTAFPQGLQLGSGGKIPSPKMVFLPSPGLEDGVQGKNAGCMKRAWRKARRWEGGALSRRPSQ